MNSIIRFIKQSHVKYLHFFKHTFDIKVSQITSDTTDHIVIETSRKRTTLYTIHLDIDRFTFLLHGPLLLTWFNVIPNMDEQPHVQQKMRWNYLSKPIRHSGWRSGMDKQFHPIRYDLCNYLSLPGLKLVKGVAAKFSSIVPARQFDVYGMITHETAGVWCYSHNKTKNSCFSISKSKVLR